GSYLVIGNNLSDLNNVATARTNLGLTSMATETASRFISSSTTSYLLRDGSLSMTGALNMAGNAITNIAGITISGGQVKVVSAPSANIDLANKAYVDGAV